jgi:hypothetical protein
MKVRSARVALTTALLVVTAGVVTPGIGAPGAGAAAIARPDGAGPPVKASGMGTQAALDNPRCRHDDARYGPYGRFDSTVVGGGPPCVKEWSDGDDNGGATSRGVTADRIKVVFVLPSSAQRDPVPPTVRDTQEKGTYQDGIHDYLRPTMRFYETWGRDLEVTFFTSSGIDESAQRADAVAIGALKPFAVVNLANGPDLPVLESELAAARILVQGYTATPETSQQQSPYRWGSADQQAAVINAAEVLGKQLVGTKAEYGGDDVKDTTRTFGLVYQETVIDGDRFQEAFAKHGGKVATEGAFTSNVSEDVQAQAPTIVSRMKSAGVTTVVPFVDFTTMQALMEQASLQDWFPEWFFTGALYQDLGLTARNYPVDQSRHAFGIGFIYPWTEEEVAPPDGVSYADQIDYLNWYWGQDRGTFTARYNTPILWWLLSGIHAAGPDLTPKTFKQGLFALPPRGGAAADEAHTSLVAFGKGPRLPYDEYSLTGYDFAPFYWDPDTEGPSNGLGTVGRGVGWVLDGGKRYVATTWPKKPFRWFDDDDAIYHFPTRPEPVPEYVGDCDDCPATTGQGSPGAPSDDTIVVEADGTGASAA